MIRVFPAIALLSVLLCACAQTDPVPEPEPEPQPGPETEIPEGMFTVTSPAPSVQIKGVSLAPGQAAFVNASNAMGFKLLRGLYDGEGIILSPLSLYLALGMVAAGVEGESQKEFEALLGGGIPELNAFSKSILEQLPAVDLETKVKLSDAVIINDKYKVRVSYKEAVGRYYYAPVENISFNDLDWVKKVVNAWCYRETEGLIPSILDEVNPDTAAYLLNALYFKAAWTRPYEKGQVVRYPFTGSAAELDYLCSEWYNTLYADMGDYRIASVDYSNGKYRFYILLPKKGDGLGAMLKTLEGQDWSALASSLKPERVRMRFPKIDCGSTHDLKDPLKALGLQKAFLPSQDYSPMFEAGLYFISKVIQKAKISVDEKGTEAAAVTAIAVDANSLPSSDPIEFFADHPFVYLISETTSSTILFTGIFDGK